MTVDSEWPCGADSQGRRRAASRRPVVCAARGRRCPRVGDSVETKGRRCTSSREHREGEEETWSSPGHRLGQQKPRLLEQGWGDPLCAVPENGVMTDMDRSITKDVQALCSVLYVDRLQVVLTADRLEVPFF